MFWNLNKKNLVQELMEAVWENNIEIIMAVEAECLDIQYFISRMKDKGTYFSKKEMFPKAEGIVLLANTDIEVSVYKEEKHFTAYKVYENDKNFLLIVVHLISAMYYSEAARNHRAGELSRILEKLEELCNKEAEKEGKQQYNTIIVGDFNLHPFSAGMIGTYGFHAIMDPKRAMKKSKIINGNKVKFYYNPIWNLMGKRGHALGTYYYEQDQNDDLFYWYTFDQILLRPALINEFVWDEFEILDHIGSISLINNDKIYKEKYSDHLPIKFTIG